MSSRKPSRGWLGSALAIGTAVAAGAAIYHYAASWTRAAAVETPGDASSGDAETTATAPARAARPTKRDKQAAAASRAQAELLGALDDARDDDDDDEEDERVVGTLGDRSSSFSAAAARAKTLTRVSNENKLRLYALYKQATAGPCASPKPRLVDGMTAHAKWTAWRDLGETLSSRDAATAYIRLVEELSGGDARTKARAEAATGANIDIADIDGEGDTIGFGGPVFSRPAMPGDPRDFDRSRTPPSDDQGVDGGSPRRLLDAGLEALAEACRGGDAARVRAGLARPGVDANAADEEGRTALHWAADGGHEDAAAALLAAGAVADARDEEGQTPLHYAATVEAPGVCALLLEAGADPEAEDRDGDTPSGLGAIELAKRARG